jgi:hypothetical protein
MSATVIKWEKRATIAETMVKQNFTYWELSSGYNTKAFLKYDVPGALSNDAAEALTEALDTIAEGVVIVTIKENAKTKTNWLEYYFKVKEAPVVNGVNADYINEKIDWALFKQKVELTASHQAEVNRLTNELNDLKNAPSEDIFDKITTAFDNIQKLSAISQARKLKQPIAAINGVNEDLQRIYSVIPEDQFNDILKQFADKLTNPKTQFSFLSKLNEVFGEDEAK